MVKLPNTTFIHVPRIEHGRRPVTLGVVIHTIEGSDDSAINFFEGTSPDGVGAHVVVGQTKVVQLADLDQICYHAVGANRAWIGFEHEGAASYPKNKWLNKENRHLLRTSANRVAWVCWHYSLGTPKHHKNVKGHVDFPEGGHTDPGKGWPWWFYMYLCRRAYNNLKKKGKWA